MKLVASQEIICSTEPVGLLVGQSVGWFVSQSASQSEGQLVTELIS